MTPPAGMWLLGLGTVGCTLAGGALALRLGRDMRLLTGVSAGAMVGLALFELIPEAAALKGGVQGLGSLMLAVGAGFALYMALQGALARAAASRVLSHLGPASLTLHSLFDGLGIGLAFKVSEGVGLSVAAAVLAHDLCDGVNTITVALRDGSPAARRSARRWLAVNAASPLLGMAVATLAPVGASVFAPLAAAFAGVFLYIGAVELLPRSYAGWPGPLARLPAIFGLASIYLVSSLAR